MDLSNFNGILTLTGTFTAIGGAYYTVLKIAREIRKSKKSYADKILDEAKEYDKEIKAKLEGKIDLLESQLHNLELNINKDLIHIKESQASEIKNLGQKIEELRQEIQTGHGSLINLLTRLVDKN